MAPAILEDRGRRVDRLMGFPNVPRAVPFRASTTEHENPILAGFGPAVDAFACLSNLLLDLLEDGFVQGRHLHEFPVPDAPHRNREAGVAGRDFDERIVVLGPERDLPEAHALRITVLAHIATAVIRRPPMAGQIGSLRTIFSRPRHKTCT